MPLHPSRASDHGWLSFSMLFCLHGKNISCVSGWDGPWQNDHPVHNLSGWMCELASVIFDTAVCNDAATDSSHVNVQSKHNCKNSNSTWKPCFGTEIKQNKLLVVLICWQVLLLTDLLERTSVLNPLMRDSSLSFGFFFFYKFSTFVSSSCLLLCSVSDTSFVPWTKPYLRTRCYF